jgi:tetratricopeptide (TPR) repeat protein
MTVPPWLLRAIAAVFCGVMASGCFPSHRGQLNEEKEPHFLNGRSLVNAMDFAGAINAFQKALEVNPHSASAHFELGWLYADKAADPAAAIYHYQRYLELRPRAENAETVGQHIFSLKQELAKAVLPMPSTPAIQRDFERLAQENRALQEELERLRIAFAGRTNAANMFVSPDPGYRAAQPQEAVGGGTSPVQGGSQLRSVAPNPTTSRTHKVQSGETPSSIARKYQVKLDKLLAANPGLDPKRMRVGQLVNIPAS